VAAVSSQRFLGETRFVSELKTFDDLQQQIGNYTGLEPCMKHVPEVFICTIKIQMSLVVS
jgi:hypothetical protein